MEDIGVEDITTNSIIKKNMKASAKILAREEGIIAGVRIAEEIFKDFNLECITYKDDGEKVAKDECVMRIKGNARKILTLERSVLNIMMRMSGIATITNKIVNKVKSVNPKVIVACTRKTTPGMQWLEKLAVKIGGGDTHRFRLDDCAMIKDNHLALVGLEKAMKMLKKKVSFTKKIEVEVENINDAILAAKLGADIILLDNMSPKEIKMVINELKKRNLRNKVILEASGNIKPNIVQDYARTGVDVISLGFITHSAPALDLSLEIEKDLY